MSKGSRDISIIIPALNEGKSAEVTVDNIRKTIGLDNYEIIIVDSGGTETAEIRTLPMVNVYSVSRLGAPQARNFGASKASGDFFLFIDSHMEFIDGWGEILLEQSRRNDKSIITPTIWAIGDYNCRCSGFKWKDINMEIEYLPDVRNELHEVPFACGGCMAISRELFDALGKFDSGIRFWGLEDSEICMRSWLYGYSVLCAPSIKVGHRFRISFPYKVESYDITYNKLWFAFSHFAPGRLSRYLKLASLDPNFVEALLMCLDNKVLERKRALLEKRVYDDNWFFAKFPMAEWLEANNSQA